MPLDFVNLSGNTISISRCKHLEILIVCRLFVFISAILYVRRIEDMDIVKVFGTNLKKYRAARGFSQEAFADKCGLHRTYISAIECYRRSISLENIQRIADALEIDTYKLFIEEKNTDEG